MSDWLSGKLQRWFITADKATTQARKIFGFQQNAAADRSTLRLSGLEPRILFSATPMDPALMEAADETATVATLENGEEVQESNLDEQSSVAQATPSEIIIIDASVPEIQQLLDDLEASENNIEVFVLDGDRDGIDQITEILDQRSDLQSLHIVSHGDAGVVTLGNTQLTEQSLDGYAGQIASWQNAFSADADILFYGCDLASTSEGQQLVESLSVLTGTDVAASTDDTGHGSLGGDWVLEYGTGKIDVGIAFSEAFQANWVGLLPANQAPTISAPGGQHVSLDRGVEFSTSNGNEILIGDPDAAMDDEVQVTVTVDQGTLTLEKTDGLTLLSGQWFNGATFEIRGTIDDINAAFNGMVYLPDTGWMGVANLSILVDDLGNNGTGGAQTAEHAMSISVDDQFGNGTTQVADTGLNDRNRHQNRGVPRSVAAAPNGESCRCLDRRRQQRCLL